MSTTTRDSRTSARLLTGSGLIIALALFLGVNIIANQTLTRLRVDVTANHLYTLSVGTRNILAQIDEPLTVRLYFSATKFAGVPQFLSYGNRVRDMLGEYVAASGGSIELQVIDPEPFSVAEDQAVGFGIQQIPLSAAGEMGYLGLVGTNTTDDEVAIALLNPEQEDSLEYELTKMIYKLAHPQRQVVGMISTLPVMGGAVDPRAGEAPGGEPWTAVTLLRESFEVRELDARVDAIDDQIDILIVVHPKDLPRTTLYAIDQFVLHGGRAIVFVDPLAEEDQATPNPETPMVMPKMDSSLEPLFAQWGIRLVPDKVVGDADAAVRVSFRGNRGPQEIEYLPWVQLQGERLNRDDFTTSKLNVVNFGSAGALEPIDGAKTTMTALITSSPNSALIDRDAIMLVRDPAGLLANFKPGGTPLVLAARVHGEVETAFPEGRPLDEKDKRAPQDPKFVAKSTGPVNVIVVADTDILADRFWVRVENFLGMRVPTPIANNADFLMNALENLGGNDDMISLRSRGVYSRPFKVVDQIQREAEAQFRDRERALQTKLEETEAKIRDLQQKRDSGGGVMLSTQQKQEIDLFRKEQLKTRTELRAVQHDLQKNIERLGAVLKFINIGLVPVLLTILAVTASLVKLRRRAA